ncbi:MAG TPA: glycerol-3-phosphate dehydrogenase/oxidase, partial [Vitreimonas sp.]|nr:glycerol-3-phosphate dehydrogenase/oxidase [Vitreimonas sp.]
MVAWRHDALSRLEREPFDLLVIGGGITGSGIALDAAARGLSVALVEADDIASGTSSRSSKLIHGGLRYLEQFRFRLVREALAERHLLLRLAPHLVRIEPFVVPVFGSPIQLGYIGAGLTLYDLLGAARDGGRTRYLGPSGVRRLVPAVRRTGLAGGFVYHDGVEDDARLALAVARTARQHGAVVATRARALATSPGGTGRVDGVIVRDELTGNDLFVRAAVVVDAAGPVDAFDATEPPATVIPSRGAHVVLRRSRIPIEYGMTLRVPGRVVFLIPWGAYWLLGTTDVAHTGSTTRPSASTDEVAYLLDSANAALDVDLDWGDVVATFAGVRPLSASGAGTSTVLASREHSIETGRDGVIRVRGGKYTTYRRTAAEVVDRVLGADARRRPSVTADLPLAGALASSDLAGLAQRLAGRFEVPAGVATALVRRHGTDAQGVLELGAAAGLLRPLVAGHDYVEAEVPWAAREELALGVEDVLARRTRLAIEQEDQA